MHMAREPDPTVDRRAARGLVGDEVAYILPMAAFMLLLWVGGQWEWLYPASYVARTVIVAGLLIALRRHYTAIRWDYWWLGAIVGVVGILQWVGMEKLIEAGARHWGWMKYLSISVQPFDPTAQFNSAWELWGFIAVRLAGAVLVVPVMEELFWRDYLWRQILAPNDFKLAAVGEWDWRTYLIVAGAFAMVHPTWLTAVVWALMIGGLLVWTRSLGACIVAHAVTNLLLGAYVLAYRDWRFW